MGPTEQTEQTETSIKSQVDFRKKGFILVILSLSSMYLGFTTISIFFYFCLIFHLSPLLFNGNIRGK